MFCPKCGKQIHQDSQFCFICGHKIDLSNLEGDAQPEPVVSPQEDEQAGRQSKAIVAAIAVFGALMIALLIFAWWYEAKEKERQRQGLQQGRNSVRQLLSIAIPKPTPYWEKAAARVSRQAIALKPGEYYISTIVIDPQWKTPRLKGRFHAQGGSGNDVRVAVTNEDGLINFKNNHEFKAWYHSGKVTTDTIDVAIGPGKYYFIVSNKYSIFAHKSVEIDLNLEYEYLIQP